MSPLAAPLDEPLKTTIVRNGAIALVLGTVIFVATAHRTSWPAAVLVAAWPTFGGHWIELVFLNWLRPRIAPERRVQVFARIALWVVGGDVIAVMMWITAHFLGGADVAWRTVWFGGPAFIVIELVVHLGLAARGQPSFYDGRG
jgi:hypothetical protein